MCGIHAILSTANAAELSQDLRQALRNRGPDYLGEATRTFPAGASQDLRVLARFTSTVLALRGDHVAKQPFEDPNSGAVFCWNGEAWKIDSQIVDGNDGEAIFARLSGNKATGPEPRHAYVLNVLRSIQGPFAFIYYDASSERLYFGRDRLGRRSLLMNDGSDGTAVAFSSVADAPHAEWKEVIADGIYSMCFKPYQTEEGNLSLGASTSKDDWLSSGGADLVSSIGIFNEALPQPDVRLDFGSPSVRLLRHHLTEALKLRILNVPEPPYAQFDIDTRIAILFSGGLDCTLLARLADDLLPEDQGVDLINVAFENPRVAANFRKDVNVYEACPDRLTGRKAFGELKKTCPARNWRFIAVNVPFEEAMLHKSRVVSLIHPHDTQMDLSIGLALYFAARGIGDGYPSRSGSTSPPPSISTPARVLVSGLGADELFGGYSRHKSGFERRGYQGLVDELKLDVSRISQRNLGRDDRIMAHWGKEVRFPFLDEEFVKVAMQCPVWEKCDFGNPFHAAIIEPAKRVLRLIADQLGLQLIAREKKRAIQFGSRTAKIGQTSGRVRGTDRINEHNT
ncbi:asparagine synthase [Pseudomassariella vexata]|uniref:Asparagine synthase n=1 Tax=Pseudomassariella vexata TaxID=1141098 RepID=A0A1Y2DLZ6_9PEZI|nr:asparagine synthase [Pseudomassariella vexata]ORY60280.1 asparagine synthase [Pseudomassariella vexata]